MTVMYLLLIFSDNWAAGTDPTAFTNADFRITSKTANGLKNVMLISLNTMEN